MSVFGIPVSGPDARKVQVQHELGTASLMVEEDISLVIEHQMLPDEQFDLERFSVFPCYSSFTLASQITELRVEAEGERVTFGYVFPVTSFRNEIGFDKKFGLVYAEAAFRKFLTVKNIETFQAAFDIEQAEVSHLPLDAVIDDSLSILAVSNEVLEQQNISGDVLELMLRRAEIQVSLESKSGPSFVSTSEYCSGLNLKKPEVKNEDEISRICLLLKNADEDNSEIGAFIQYYQFFEYMLLKIFEWGMPHVAKSGASPWEMRDLLNDLGAERKRLYRLDAHCVPDWNDRGSQDLLKDACGEFLATVGVDPGKKEAWHALLYLVRNSVVHNQFRLLSPEYLAQLRRVNTRLRSVALDCFFNFREPGPEAFSV